jgi:hypothetical protein
MNKKYQYTSQKELRGLFKDLYPHLHKAQHEAVKENKKHGYDATAGFYFTSLIDSLGKSGAISPALVKRATL